VIRQLLSALTLFVLAVCANAADRAGAAPAAGIDLEAIDRTVRPQDDFYAWANGNWLKATAIPPDRISISAFTQLGQAAQERLRALVEADRADAQAKPGSEARKLGDLYASFMDQDRRDALGYKPLVGELQRIRALKDKRGLPALVAHLVRIGVAMPYDVTVYLDEQDPGRYAVHLDQDGLGLPDRDCYLQRDDPKPAGILHAYQRHVAQILALAGGPDAEGRAAMVVAFETALARAQWTRVELRDPDRSYNKLTPAALATLAPGYDWRAALAEAGVGTRTADLIAGQPGYLSALDRILAATDLETLKAYCEWHLLHAYARYLSTPFVDADFGFYGRLLSGQAQPPSRQMLALATVERTMGMALGRAYVAAAFPPQQRQRIEAIAANVRAAFHDAIANAAWMGPQAKRAAEAKLAALSLKIGYPDRWRDYGRLAIKPDDLAGNIMRANGFDYQRKLDKLGKPVDRGEWVLTPQTVNAYYNPQLNEAVFTAAMLQPPLFAPDADDAANYGAIGATLAHTVAQAFDLEGSRWDGEGRLRDWMAADDRARLQARIGPLVAQYDSDAALPGRHMDGRHVDGRLTLTANAADVAGVEIAYRAWRLALRGREPAAIDGLSGAQRFFTAFAQMWRSKTRDAAQIEQLHTDPHAPARFRANGPLRNQAAFYDAFGVVDGDAMYLPPDRRVTIW
jgi:predicted metalloendopeptidase